MSVMSNSFCVFCTSALNLWLFLFHLPFSQFTTRLESPIIWTLVWCFLPGSQFLSLSLSFIALFFLSFSLLPFLSWSSFLFQPFATWSSTLFRSHLQSSSAAFTKLSHPSHESRHLWHSISSKGCPNSCAQHPLFFSWSYSDSLDQEVLHSWSFDPSRSGWPASAYSSSVDQFVWSSYTLHFLWTHKIQIYASPAVQSIHHLFVPAPIFTRV